MGVQRYLSYLVVATLLAGLTGCGQPGPAARPPLRAGDAVPLVRRTGPAGTTRFMAKNVVYRMTREVTMTLEDMNADILLKDTSLPFVPANKDDYAIVIHQARVTKDAASLEATLNGFVFGDKDSPLKNLKVAFRGDRLVLAGEMWKGVWVGFEMEGALSPTKDGKIVLTPNLIKSMGVRVDGLLGLFGLEMAALLKTKEEKGVTMAGNSIVLDPGKLYPAPRLLGRVTAVGIRGDRLAIVFDDGRAQPWPAMPVAKPRSCLLMWGGDVLINTALSLNAKFQILDASPDTPQVFALDLYREQLEAGFLTATKDGHMIAYVPDITDYTPELGRFTPPVFPIPGVPQRGSDMGGPVQPQRR